MTFNFKRKERRNLLKLVAAIGLITAGTAFALPVKGFAQTVVIPECPSVEDFPKPGCFDEKKKDADVDKKEPKIETKDKQKPKKS